MIASLRTHTCGQLGLSNIGKNVKLCGWVFRIRSFGSMIFVDLRDRYGWTQLVFDESINAHLCHQARQIGREYVLYVEGIVRERINKNPHIITGDVEVVVNEFKILSLSQVPPFTLENQTDGGEEIRMRYRYLDLRRQCVQEIIIFRHNAAQYIRNFLNLNDFLEIETPFLIKSTPEGARDFIVPSRLYPGSFFALPQSPQLFKQLLMVAGFDRYYQIVKCFRDEDFRADRQPEFTQIDCEMSFVTQDNILNMFENMIKDLFEKMLSIKLPDFPRISYVDAISLYGTDKPDLRFQMTLNDLTQLTRESNFKDFRDNSYVGAICVDKGSKLSRKKLDEIIEYFRQPQVGGKTIVWIRWNEDDTFKSNIEKFCSCDEFRRWFAHCNGKKEDLLLIASGDELTTKKQLGLLRQNIAENFNLIPRDTFAPCWITDFPLFELDSESNKLITVHHPFTSPKESDTEKLWSDPLKAKALAYDMVINGVEIGGGSIRIYDSNIQRRIFKLLELSDEQIERQFGFLMQAFQYGVPPHGGIAFGFDRLIALMTGNDTIRNTIAFPKNSHGRDPMLEAPAPIDQYQLDELHITLKTNTT